MKEFFLLSIVLLVGIFGLVLQSGAKSYAKLSKEEVKIIHTEIKAAIKGKVKSECVDSSESDRPDEYYTPEVTTTSKDLLSLPVTNYKFGKIGTYNKGELENYCAGGHELFPLATDCNCVGIKTYDYYEDELEKSKAVSDGYAVSDNYYAINICCAPSTSISVGLSISDGESGDVFGTPGKKYPMDYYAEAPKEPSGDKMSGDDGLMFYMLFKDIYERLTDEMNEPETATATGTNTGTSTKKDDCVGKGSDGCDDEDEDGADADDDDDSEANTEDSDTKTKGDDCPAGVVC